MHGGKEGEKRDKTTTLSEKKEEAASNGTKAGYT